MVSGPIWERHRSQEVIRCSPVDVAQFVLLRRRLELQEGVFHELVHLHHSGLVAASVAVVWSREHRDDVSVVGPVVAVHHKLMGSSDQLQVVRVVELLRDVLAERVAGTSRRDTPAASVVRVRPKQIANGAFVRNLHESIELLDLFEGVNAGRETSMKAENAVFNNSGEGQEIKERGEVLPDIGVSIFSQALVVKAVYLSDLLALVISSQNGDSLGVPHF